MYHTLPRSASFWAFLFTIDQDLAKTTRERGCPCGGRLHRSNYARKQRGGPDTLPDTYRARLSFCCDRDGCRKRATPPSVRFLGRKVYLGAVVVLISAMRHGASQRRARELSTLFGADRRTIARWQSFWCEFVPQTPFWKVARARLTPVADVATLPLSLLTAFLRHPLDDGWTRLLRFLAPITTATDPPINVSR
jgi:hypothetical protein